MTAASSILIVTSGGGDREETLRFLGRDVNATFADCNSDPQRAQETISSYRDRVDAILVGVDTVIQDDPLLTARPEGKTGKPLIRVVLDSRLRTPPESRSLPPDRGVATIIAATEAANREKEADLAGAGAEIIRLPADPQGRVALSPLMAELHRREIRHLLVEGMMNVITTAAGTQLGLELLLGPGFGLHWIPLLT